MFRVGEALRVCMSSVPDFDPKIFFQYLTGNSKKFTASVLEKMLKANNVTRRSNDRSLTQVCHEILSEYDSENQNWLGF